MTRVWLSLLAIIAVATALIGAPAAQQGLHRAAPAGPHLTAEGVARYTQGPREVGDARRLGQHALDASHEKPGRRLCFGPPSPDHVQLHSALGGNRACRGGVPIAVEKAER